jgi:hypothetical protein
MNIEVGGLYHDEWKWSQQFTEREYRDFAYQDRHFSEADYEKDYSEPLAKRARPSVASAVQPCASLWVRRAFLSVQTPS